MDKADVALLFFTQESLQSSWVDKEIKHVLREESKKGNNFDLNKIISIFDSKKTYEEISNRYPELTDDLLHLMPKNYTKKELGQLISAIWSKYLSLQGGDIETQKQLLTKDREIFQKDKEIQILKSKINDLKSNDSTSKVISEFEKFYKSKKTDSLISNKQELSDSPSIQRQVLNNISDLVAFGLIKHINTAYVALTDKGNEYLKWFILEKESKHNNTFDDE